MSELKNWDVYSSDEEVEKFEELDTKQKEEKEEVSPKHYSEIEKTYLEKFLPLAENSLDVVSVINFRNPSLSTYSESTILTKNRSGKL